MKWSRNKKAAEIKKKEMDKLKDGKKQIDDCAGKLVNG